MSVNKNHLLVLPILQPKIKKAQIGETMTWIIATIVIIAILIISIYISSLLGEAKSNISYKDFERKNDLLMEKSLFAYFLSDESQVIYGRIKEQETYDDLDDKIKEVKGVLE